MTQGWGTGLFGAGVALALVLAACAPVTPTRTAAGPYGGQIVCALPDCSEAQLRRALYGRQGGRWPARTDVAIFIGSGHRHGDTFWGLALGF